MEINAAEYLTVGMIGKVEHIACANLVRIEADSNYSRLFLSDGTTLFVAKVLKKFVAELAEHNFIRPHKTHLVNTAYIDSFIRSTNSSLVLSTGDRIPVARNNKNKIRMSL